MPIRTASARWQGNLTEGSGTVRTGKGGLTGNYSFKSRFEEGEGTNPEELIAAAHAACFSMALANGLAAHGHAPERVATTAQVRLEPKDGGFAITRIDLDTEVSVGEIKDEEHLRKHAEEAKANCPVSVALGAVPEITVQARLV
jgi:lipoyl-dependent peroxiredoxin